MQVMIWTELKKLRRSRMLLVALFGLCMVLVIVTAQGFFAGGNEAYGMEPEWYLTGVQSLGTLYALPGIIALFGSYIITPLSRSLWETWEPYPNCIRWWLRSRFPGITNPPRRKSCSV